MKVFRLRRSHPEYNISKRNKLHLINLSTPTYIEYNREAEIILRAKEAARCYMAVGNIPMMLNKLYSTIRFEENI